MGEMLTAEFPYVKFLGLTDKGSPVFHIKGGAPEDGGDEGAEDGPDVDEGDETEEEGEETADNGYAPPSKEEFDRIMKKLGKANKEAADRRHWLDKHGIDPRSGERYDADEEEEDPTDLLPPKKKGKKSEEDDDDAATAVVTKLQREHRIEQKKAAQKEARLMSALGKSAAKSALAEAGWNGKGANVIERMIDLSEIEIDDEGNVIGLDDQIAEVKGDMPEWFKQTRAKRQRPASSSADVDGADKGSAKPPAEPKGWLARLEDQFQGIDE